MMPGAGGGHPWHVQAAHRLTPCSFRTPAAHLPGRRLPLAPNSPRPPHPAPEGGARGVVVEDAPGDLHLPVRQVSHL